ncbi:MAG: ribosomal protein S18-alanine N-acetyltransferase [Gammaproteobacteria bacterium]|nr:ribosomal protein S18-alanine N-acetyltransferase [Gammaproteobacteria bacterium]
MTEALPTDAENHHAIRTESHYRLMRLDDVKSVFEIDKQVYPFPWTEGIFEDCIKTGHLCVVNEIDSQIVAYGIIGMIVDEAHILNLSVSRPFQGKGYGRELLIYLLALMKRGNAVRALLEVRESNQTAISLYHSLGFEKIGTRKGYYPAEDGREDATVLAKSIA